MDRLRSVVLLRLWMAPCLSMVVLLGLVLLKEECARTREGCVAVADWRRGESMIKCMWYGGTRQANRKEGLL